MLRSIWLARQKSYSASIVAVGPKLSRIQKNDGPHQNIFATSEHIGKLKIPLEFWELVESNELQKVEI